LDDTELGLKKQFSIAQKKNHPHPCLMMGSMSSIPAMDGQVAQHLLGDKTWLHYWPRRMASAAGAQGELRRYRPQLVVVTWRIEEVGF
jgi:hypothetical protein